MKLSSVETGFLGPEKGSGIFFDYLFDLHKGQGSRNPVIELVAGGGRGNRFCQIGCLRCAC